MGSSARSGARGLDEGAGHRHPLLLAAGERARAVVGPVRQPQLARAAPRARRRASAAGPARDEQRHHHVLEGGELRQQVVELEDEARGCGCGTRAGGPRRARTRPRRRPSPCPPPAGRGCRARAAASTSPPRRRRRSPASRPRATSRSRPVEHGHVPGGGPVALHDARARRSAARLIRSAGLPRDPAGRRRGRGGWWPGSRSSIAPDDHDGGVLRAGA